MCLQDGLKLDLNKLGFVRRGAKVGPHYIRWTHTYTSEEIASGLIVANTEENYGGWLRILIGRLDQWIGLVAQPGQFGGRQRLRMPRHSPTLFGFVEASWRSTLLRPRKTSPPIQKSQRTETGDIRVARGPA